jgi:dihydrofolate reductase
MQFNQSLRSCSDSDRELNGPAKIIVYIATSADGFIARPDGSVDWLNRPRTAGDYGMGEFLSQWMQSSSEERPGTWLLG